jgi:hypothetical protein
MLKYVVRVPHYIYSITFIYLHRYFIPQASNAFRSFFLDSKLQALGSMVTSLLLCRFCPTRKCMFWFPWLHQLNILCCNHGNLATLNNLKPLLSKAEWCRYCNHLLPPSHSFGYETNMPVQYLSGRDQTEFAKVSL